MNKQAYLKALKPVLEKRADAYMDVLRGVPGGADYSAGARSNAVHSTLAGTDQYNTIHEVLGNLNPINAVAYPAAALLAALTKTRSLKEQAEVSRDPDYAAKSWLIPGYGAYNHYKALGVANQIGKDREGYTDKDLAKTKKELDKAKK